MKKTGKHSSLKRMLCTGILAASFLAGCSEDSSTTGTTYFSKDKVTSPRISEAAYEELTLTHELLDIYYYDAHLKNELDSNVDVYLDYSADFRPQSDKSLCTSEFASVCFMFSQMSDRFTRYFDPYFAMTIYSSFEQTETTVGIGAEVEEVQDSTGSYLVISNIYDNSPSAQTSLAEGDRIISIDGNIPANQIGFEKLTSGNIGDTVTIVTSSDGEEKTVSVMLNEYGEPSVHLSYVDSIPVIKISEFTPITSSQNGTLGEFKKFLKKINEGNTKAVIVDLRDNPGGEESQCVGIAAEFLGKGDTIFSRISTTADSSTTQNGVVYRQAFDTLTIVAPADGNARDLYTVFIANENSASCAEVMLSAVTINRKVPVVGTTSYGKGIGQILIPPDRESTLGLSIITSAHVEDKNHKSYHGYGIAPDYEITVPNEQLQKAVELAREAKEKRVQGYGKTPTGNFKRSSSDFSRKNPDLGLYTILR